MGFGSRFGGAEFAEGFEGGEIGFAGGEDTAFDQFEKIGSEVDGFAEVEVSSGDFARVLGKHFAFCAQESAETPLIGDEAIDEAALFGSGGSEALVVFGDEAVERFGIFGVRYHVVFGVDASGEGIVADGGFAFGSSGSGGALRVAAIGFNLFEGCHRDVSKRTVAGRWWRVGRGSGEVIVSGGTIVGRLR